ncbi:hypothetical protein BH20CHL6_BH20CHL6_10370 [soil metagenome]
MERQIARLLSVGALAIVTTVSVGSLLIVAAGNTPVRQPGPPLDPTRIPADILALRAEGFLWLGLTLTLALPTARVVASLLGFLRQGDRAQALVAAAVLAVLALAVCVALLTR